MKDTRPRYQLVAREDWHDTPAALTEIPVGNVDNRLAIPGDVVVDTRHGEQLTVVGGDA